MYESQISSGSQRFRAFLQTLGEDHPATNRALIALIDHAPEQLKKEISAKARELGLIPDAFGYLDDGSPVYRLADVAAKLGMSTEEAENMMNELGGEEAFGISNMDALRTNRRQ